MLESWNILTPFMILHLFVLLLKYILILPTFQPPQDISLLAVLLILIDRYV